MAEIKLPAVSYKELGEQGARYALDEVEYEGLTIRQWADKITGGEYAPVVHSKWEICCDGYYPYCKRCRNEPQGRVMTQFCPNCGAKMDEEV